MNPAFLLLAALLLPATSALAGNWHILQNNSRILLESNEPLQDSSESNIQNNDKKKEKILKIWGKSTYSRPEQAQPGDFYYSSEKTLLSINCTKHTFKKLQKIYHSADGQEIKSIRFGDSGNFEPIIPDSTEEMIHDFSCGFKAEKTGGKAAKPTQPQPIKPAIKSAPVKKTAAVMKSSENSKPKAGNKN